MNQGTQSGLLVLLTIILFSIIFGLAIAFLPNLKEVIVLLLVGNTDKAPVPK